MATFQEIIKGDKPVLVDFHADWCKPCKMMNPTLKSIKKHFGDDIKILKINVDNNEKVAGKFQVRGIPTFILFNEGRAVNISKFLYTCMLSEFITTPLIFLAREIDKSDFPVAVGPAIT